MTGSTIDRPGKFDALEKARPDEMIFTLLERDPASPPAILHWVDIRRAMARNLSDPDERRAELQQCTDAEFIAFEMESRQKGIAAETSGAAVPKQQSYSGEVNPNAERDAMMVKMRGFLGDADYNATEALEIMDALASFEGPVVSDALLDAMRAARNALHEIVMQLSPMRQAYNAEPDLPLASDGDG